jgi:ABC-type sugar transport system, periplasmic component
MLMYRKDLFAKAGLTMPEQPTWDFVKTAAAKITDPATETYGICLRGKAGWGENMAFLTTLANAFGGRWFNEQWKPEFDGPEWKAALTFYVDLMKNYGPPGASSNGFNENLALFNSGKCGMWVDATVAASFVSDPKQSKVADQVGFAPGPLRGHLQGRQLALGLVAGHSRRLAEGRGGREVHRLGDGQGISPARGRQGGLGECPAGHPQIALCQCRII